MRIEDAKTRLIEMLATGTPKDGPRKSISAIWYGLARLVRGGDPAAALALIETGLEIPDMINAMGYARLVIRHREVLSPALLERVAEHLTEGMRYGGIYDSIHTENHKVMLATSRLLAAQAFSDRRIEGTRASVAYQASVDWLRAWIETRSIWGHPEFHSPGYSMLYAMPLLNLRDCAVDPGVRRMAEMMVDYVAIAHAASHLDGRYAGGHSRTYDFMAVETLTHPSQLWSVAYYGASEARDIGSLPLIFPACDSDYIPHPAILAAATDRARPYASRERYAEVGTNGVPVDIARYVWMTDSFALSSLQGAAWPDQQGRWSLKIAGKNPHATVLMNQPGKFEKSGMWPGASEYEHILQHRGTILVSYAIPESDPHPFVRAHLPGEADAWAPDPGSLGGETAPRWLCFRAEGTFVALYPIAPFVLDRRKYEGGWLDEQEYAGRPYWHIESRARFTGMVIEAQRAADWASFDAFVARVGEQSPAVDLPTGTIRYRSLDGADLRLVNSGPDPGAKSYLGADGKVPVVQTHLHYRAQRPRAEHAIDGVAPGYADWPTHESPFARCEFGSGLFRIEHGDRGIELDFRNWRKREW